MRCWHFGVIPKWCHHTATKIAAPAISNHLPPSPTSCQVIPIHVTSVLHQKALGFMPWLLVILGNWLAYVTQDTALEAVRIYVKTHWPHYLPSTGIRKERLPLINRDDWSFSLFEQAFNGSSVTGEGSQSHPLWFAVYDSCVIKGICIWHWQIEHKWSMPHVAFPHICGLLNLDKSLNISMFIQTKHPDLLRFPHQWIAQICMTSFRMNTETTCKPEGLLEAASG